MKSRRIETAIEIAARPAAVWAVLIDFAAYPDWNPFIRRLSGEAIVGSRLAVTVQPPGRRALTFKPTMIAAEPARELRWLGHTLIPGLLDGEHGFLLERRPTGCLFRQHETFTGILVPLFTGVLNDTERGFVAMNEALKREVETRA